MTSASVCAMCSAPETKYKCSKCKVPSCSLNCYKQHQSTCSSLDKPAAAKVDEDQHPVEIPSAFTAQLSREELKTLFKQYPELRSDLQRIYRSSQHGLRDHPDPRHDGRDQTTGRSGKAGSGFELGLKSLSDILDRNDSTSHGLEAFMRLVAEKEVPMG